MADKTPKHCIQHCIITQGRPTSAKVCQLPPAKLAIANKELTIFISLALSNPPSVYGLHHCIWWPRSQAHGIPVVIIVPSITSLHLTNIPYLISKTFELHYSEQQSSQRLTLSGPSNRFQCTKMILQRLLL